MKIEKLEPSQHKQGRWLVWLDDASIVRVGEGDVASVSLNTRQIVENAINSKAAMVALAHNHPSGVPFPSPEDREATLRIRDALEMIDVRLVEHVIVADNDYISMWESGMMGP